MKLKFVVPDMKKMFGDFKFAGQDNDKTETRRVNGKLSVESRAYHLFSNVAKSEDVVVVLPGKATEKIFDYETPVQLVNPRIIAVGERVANGAYTNYVIHADDMIKL